MPISSNQKTALVAKTNQLSALIAALVPDIAAPAPAPTPAPAPAPSGPIISTALTGIRTFNVGPGKQYVELDMVPWQSITAGDVVNIFYRPTPYKSKVAITKTGSASQPIIINGVTSSTGQLPEITGNGAITPADLRGWYDQYTEDLGVILAYNKAVWGQKIKFLTIQNLKITGCHPLYSYTNQVGVVKRWGDGLDANSGAGIYGVTVEDFTLYNVEITDNAMGVFTNTKGNAEAETSYRLKIQYSKIYDNGISGSFRRHNIYAQAVGFTIEDSYVGQLRAGALGSSLKSRSSGEVIRRCRIDAAARAIDLVEHEEGAIIFAQPNYNTPVVEDCLIVSQFGTAKQASATPIHFGGDNGWDAATYATYKKGPFKFNRNTLAFVNTSSATAWRVIAFDLPQPEQVVECSNSIISKTGDSLLQLARSFGTVKWVGSNCVSSGMVKGEVGNDAGVTVVGTPSLTSGAAILDSNFKPIGAAIGLGPL